MNKIYVVSQYWGGYDDQSSTPILATVNIDRARAKVEEMNERKAVYLSTRDQLNDHLKQWTLTNPPSTISQTKEKSGKNKKKRKVDVEIENKKNFEEYSNWMAARVEVHNQFLATLPQEVRDDLSTFGYDMYWEIDEVPLE